MGFLRFFVKQRILVNMAAILVTVSGILLFINSPKESLPKINIGVIQVNTVYYGASPSEVESLVTTPLEDAVKNVKGVKEVNSLSSESVSVILLTLYENVKDTGKVIDDVKNAADKAVPELPSDAELPEVIEISTEEFPVIQVAVQGTAPYAVLREHAAALEESLMRIRGVSSVQKLGFNDKAVWVNASREKLERHDISLLTLVNTFRDKNISIPAGFSTFSDSEYSVRVLAQLKNREDIEDVIIRSNYSGKKIKVSDIASVAEGFREPGYLVRADGSRAVIFTVLKRQGEDSISIADGVRRSVKQAEGSLPAGISIRVSGDNSQFIKDRLGVIYSNGALGALLVTGILFLFLRPSIALMTALGLPVAFGASLLAIKVLGIGYNMLSLFGYVIVLGMLVDDAVVVAENIYRHLEMGKDSVKAAVDGASEMLLPVAASFMTTISAFLPLLLIGGVFGGFLSPIPKAVILALTASLLECFLILPSHIADFTKTSGSGHGTARRRWFAGLREKYGNILSVIIRKRVLFSAGIILLFVLSAFLVSRRGFIFSDSQVDELSVNIKTSISNPLDVTEKAVKLAEKRLYASAIAEDLLHVHSFTGYNQKAGIEPRINGANLALMKLYFKLQAERKLKDPAGILETVRKSISGVEGIESVTVEGVRRGPSPGSDIDISLNGESFETIQDASYDLVSEISKIDGVVTVSPGLSECKREARLIINQKEAARTDTGMTEIAAILRGAVTGIEVGTIRRGADKEYIMVRLSESETGSMDDILSLKVPNRRGYRVKLSELVDVEEGCSYTVLRHKNTKKSVPVTGTIDKNVTSVTAVNGQIKDILRRLAGAYPGISYELGGEYRETSDRFSELGLLYAAALFIIFTVLATLFGSLSMPFVIMLSIPFGFTGVMLTLFAHRLPISFSAFMGFVALSGVVVNDSLIIVDFVKRMTAEGKRLSEAVIEAAGLRLRPIIITTTTTAAGVLPIGYAVFGGQDPFLRPLALVFGWGIMFSSIVTLTILPIFIILQNNMKYRLNRLLKRKQALELIP